MTVKELKQALENLPDELPVLMGDKNTEKFLFSAQQALTGKKTKIKIFVLKHGLSIA